MSYKLVTASTDLTTKGKRLYSWSLRATTAAVVNIRDTSVSGDIVVPINLAANVSASQAYPTPQGLVFPGGVYFEVVSGTVVGSLDID